MITKISQYFRYNGFILSFLLVAYLVNPYNLNFIIGYPIVALILVKKEFLLRNLDADFLILLIFSLTYGMFYSFDAKGGFQYIVIYSVFPPVFYLFGKFLFKNLPTKENIVQLLFILGFLFSLTALISVLLNFLTGGFGQLDRSLPNLWTGNPVPATIMGSYFSLNMCLPAILIADQGRLKFIYKIIAAMIFVLSLICVIRLGSRTQLGIMLITSFIALVYVIPRQSFKRTSLLFLALALATFYIYSNVSFDYDQDWLSTFAGRMEKKGAEDIASGGGRTQRWAKSLEYLFKKPFGWKTEEFGHAHNLWLDVLMVSGVIPFVLLIIYMGKSLIKIRQFIKLPTNSLEVNVMVLVYGLAFFLVFMVEPIFEGIFELFTIFCLYMGILNKYRTPNR